MSTWIDLRPRIPGLRGPRVHALNAAREPELRAVLGAEGFETVTIAGSAITNESTLFDELARAFGFGEGFGANWDALNDALGDLAGRAATRIAVVWVDAEATADADIQIFLSAVLALDAAAQDLAQAGGGGPRQLEVFLLGAEGGFPPA